MSFHLKRLEAVPEAFPGKGGERAWGSRVCSHRREPAAGPQAVSRPQTRCALTSGAMQAMFTTRCRISSVTFLAALVAAGAGLQTRPVLAQGRVAPPDGQRGQPNEVRGVVK